VIYLDTHVLVRLYHGQIEKLTDAVRREIELHDLLVSPAAILGGGLYRSSPIRCSFSRFVVPGRPMGWPATNTTASPGCR
jgi:hypothetical protein